MAAREREDHEDQAKGRDDLAEQMGRVCPMVCRDADGAQPEHRVGNDRAEAAARHLRRDIRGSVTPGQAPETGVDERDDRVEMCAGDGPEHQDDREQSDGRDGGVLEQFKADIVG